MFKKGLKFAASFVLIAGVLAGCGTSDKGAGPSTSTAPGSPSTETSQAPGAAVEGKVTASGSTALQPLVALAAEKFMGMHTKVDIAVSGGGSGTGVKNVASGVSDIGNSDVEADAQYKDQLVDHIVSLAPFVLIVSKDVTVDNLTKQQATDIFTGKIKNWKEVGGEDKAINLIQRQESSGSRKLVKKIILDGAEFAAGGVTQESSKTVAQAVSQGQGAIGYVDAPYVTEAVKGLKLDGVAFSKETIASGEYKLFGQEHMYTKGEATGATKAFLEYISSKEFMESPEVEAMGFLPADLIK